MTVREVARMASMDPWFLYQIKQITDEIKAIGGVSIDAVTADQLRTAKRMGISDERLAAGWGLTGAAGTAAVRGLRKKLCLQRVYKLADTFTAEVECHTRSTYTFHEARV